MRVRIVFLIAVVSFLAAVTLGCSLATKENYLTDFADFVSKIETECSGYSQSDWVEKDAEYLLFADEYYVRHREKLTNEDQRAIGKLKVRYHAIKVKCNAEQILDKVGDGLNQLDGIIEGVTETISNPKSSEHE